ncbi:MAG: BspA family leucine-rich repeat surface protein, partial [Bacteroidales bacterium]|nr:BspA family leucine-rich repeat surface protein [Bacteroidales bacterium]
MKKTFTLIVMLLAVFALCSTAKAADYRGYTEFNKATGVLTFKATTGTVPMSSSTVTVHDFYTGYDYSFVNDEYANKIVEVVFDGSFCNAKSDYMRLWFKGLTKLRKVSGWSNIRVANDKNNKCYDMFNGCTSLEELPDFYALNMQYVTSCNAMFKGCSSLRYVYLPDGCTNKKTEMNEMFSGCTSLELIIVTTTWKSDNISSSKNMFLNCEQLVGNGGKGKQYTSGDQVDKTHANYSTGYLTLSSLTSKKGYAHYKDGTLAFYCDFGYNYKTCYDLNSGTSKPSWVNDYLIPKVTKVLFSRDFCSFANPATGYAWFQGYKNLTTVTFEDKSYYVNFSGSLTYMFDGCNSLTSLDITNFKDVSKIADFTAMFRNCAKLVSLHLPDRASNSNTECSMASMFEGCSSLKSISFNNFNTVNVTNMNSMFRGCKALISSSLPKVLLTIDVTDMGSMFYECTSLSELPSFNATGKVVDMSYMFYGCTGLTGIITTQFATLACTSTAYMFSGCTGITDLHFIGTLQKLRNATGMFSGCTNLTRVSLNTTKGTPDLLRVSYMFQDDAKLQRILVSDIDHDLGTDKVITDTHMFWGCSSLRGYNGTKCNGSTFTDKIYARLDGAHKGYFSPYKSTITYNLDGGKVSYSNPTSYTIDDQINLNNPTRNGYQFAGWTGTGLSSPKSSVTIPSGSLGPREYTANWICDLTSGYNTIKITPSSTIYTGSNITYTITANGSTLKKGTDYSIVSMSNSTIKDAGQYTIKIKGTGKYQGETTLSFTVKQANLTITPTNVSKTYGTADDPKIEYTVAGLLNGDKLATEPVFARTAGESVGKYSVSVGTNATNSNYNIKYATDKAYFTITPKPITVTPDALSKTYGEADPTEFTYTADGLVGEDKLSGSLSRTVGEDAGEYAYSGNLTNSNYTVTINENVKFKINPKTVSKPNFVFDSEIYAYTGTEVKPLVTVLDGVSEIPASEYTVSYSNNNAVGIGTVIITDNPGGNYTVSGSAFFEIKDASETYKVDIVSFGLDAAPVTRTIYVVKNQPINNSALFDIEGYTCLGVYTDAECNNSYSFGTTPINSDISLYAKYQINKHKVVFEVDGVELNSAEYEYGATIPYQDMTKEGYTFSGWAPKPETMPDYDLTIKGNYTINKLNLVYMIDGEEYSSEQVEYGTALTIKANPSPKPGYTFSGWTPSSLPSTMHN